MTCVPLASDQINASPRTDRKERTKRIVVGIVHAAVVMHTALGPYCAKSARVRLIRDA